MASTAKGREDWSSREELGFEHERYRNQLVIAIIGMGCSHLNGMAGLGGLWDEAKLSALLFEWVEWPEMRLSISR
jgi:hypothetical protein